MAALSKAFLPSGKLDGFMNDMEASYSTSSELDDFLLVPQAAEFGFNSDESLQGTNLFLRDLFGEGSEDSSAEFTSSFSSVRSDASTRLNNLEGDLPVAVEAYGAPVRSQAQPAALPKLAALPLAPSGLQLRLDVGSVQSAWSMVGGACHPFHLPRAQLAAVAATIPSAADAAASISTSSVPELGVPLPVGPRPASAMSAPRAGPHGPAAAEAPLRSASSSHPPPLRPSHSKKAKGFFSKKARLDVRKARPDKRPRIKGRFVTRDEWDAMLCVPMLDEQSVPCCH